MQDFLIFRQVYLQKTLSYSLDIGTNVTIFTIETLHGEH